MINTSELELAQKALAAFKAYELKGANAKVSIDNLKPFGGSTTIDFSNKSEDPLFKEFILDLKKVADENSELGFITGQMGTYNSSLSGEPEGLSELLDKVTVQKRLGHKL